MATYINKQSVLDAALDDYKEFGFRLEDHGDKTRLFFKDKQIAEFFIDKVNIEVVRQGCKNYLASILAQDFQATYGEELRRYGTR